MVDFDLTEEQIAIKAMASSFAQKNFQPNAGTWDQEEIFPRLELQMVFLSDASSGQVVSYSDKLESLRVGA